MRTYCYQYTRFEQYLSKGPFLLTLAISSSFNRCHPEIKKDCQVWENNVETQCRWSMCKAFYYVPVLEWTSCKRVGKNVGVDSKEATPSLTTISVPLSKVVSHIPLSFLLLLFLCFSPLLPTSIQSSTLPVAHQYINHPDSLFISLSEAVPRTLNI